MFLFFNNIERLLRLNPQWGVLSIQGDLTAAKGSQFVINVLYDRSEKEIKYDAKIEEYIEGELITIRLDADFMSRFFSFTVIDDGDASVIKYNETGSGEPQVEKKREIFLWLRSIANYITIQEKKTLFSRVWKWFLDKVWLKMSPSGKRIALIVVISELLALLFFILLLIYLLIFKKF